MEDTSKWESLPEEVLSVIFSYLSFQERMSTISLVSDRWSKISSDIILNTSFTLRPDITSDECIQMIKAAPFLDYLKIIHRKDVNIIIRNIGKRQQNTQLKHIKIIQSSGSLQNTIIKARILVQLLSKSILLKTFKLENSHVQSNQLFTVLQNLHNLQKISLVGDKFMYKTGDILGVIRACKNLTSLKLFSNHLRLTDNNIREICTEIGSRLRKLKITADLLTDLSIDYLTSNNKELKVIHFKAANKLTEEAVLKLNQMQNIVSLGFTNLNVSWALVIFYQEWTKRLRKINLSGFVDVNDAVLNRIAINCKLVEKLDLSMCKNLTESGSGLDPVLQNCSFLRHLNLYGTPIKISQVIERNVDVLSVPANRLQEIIFCPRDYNEISIQEFQAGLDAISKCKPTLRFVRSKYDL